MKGTLIPIGGNEDKGMGKNEMYTHDFIGQGILAHVVRESGGKDSNIVIITTASSIPKEVGENYIHAFTQLGCKNIEVLDIRSREESNANAALNTILRANCVMFTGGDQSKIVDNIGGTKLHILLKEKLNDEKFVLAGTSAGAMCMSTEMISGGASTEALFKGGVSMRDGMGLIPEVIIDTHFIQRGRFGRLSESVARFPHLLGFGLAEDTGLIIKNYTSCEVIGSGMVIVFDPSHLTHNNVKILEEGEPVSITNLVVSILACGDKFYLDTRKTEVLPM